MSNSSSFLGGDFNAHSPLWNNPSTPNAHRSCNSGTYLNCLLQTFPHAALINKHMSTHLRGGVLDITFVSMELLPLTNWTLHPFLTSDYFASSISLTLPRIQLCPFELRWNIRKADWNKFTNLKCHTSSHRPPV